jgi:hypothetical protein
MKKLCEKRVFEEKPDEHVQSEIDYRPKQHVDDNTKNRGAEPGPSETRDAEVQGEIDGPPQYGHGNTEPQLKKRHTGQKDQYSCLYQHILIQDENFEKYSLWLKSQTIASLFPLDGPQEPAADTLR